MKNTYLHYFVFALLICTVIFSACKKHDDNLDEGVLIKGEISNSKTKSTKSGLTLDDADKVIVMFGERYNIVDIEHDSFSLYAPYGSVAALLFIDKDLSYIGNLFAGGLNILPLINLSEGENTIIDLSSLTLEGTSIYPTNNPIGDEIQISQEFVELLQELGSFYEAIADNIDTNQDGIPDVCSETHLVINTEFVLDAGLWGTNNTDAVLYSDSISNNLRVNLRIVGFEPIVPDGGVSNMSFIGPESNPHPDIQSNSGFELLEHCNCFNLRFSRSSGGAFDDGIYYFSLDGTNQYRLNYSSIDYNHFLVVAKPKIITDDTGKLTNIIIDYSSGDISNVDAPSFISTLMIQISINEEIISIGRIFDNIDVLPDFTNISITENINIADITNLDICYTDIIGNIYNIYWHGNNK